ncbi:N-acetylmuramoyl-L-alanine amidase [Leptothermofonsia sichuanensis E412]|uniref:peptidoglycan recognition protein family protein n=1 Tax=Leptothermofonsia sichuanensis TaxID=2917832 RepID=UPI001CA7B243|nr:peptidoglycan recognition family protein [Leptothermofonsia sichuanensis]QZZ20837.1 N-acetylmuramoyl-L-alanine amidase [Leptothermofonsia sichuanensis E412]
MRRKFFGVVALVAFCVITLSLTINVGLAQLRDDAGFESPGSVVPDPPAATQPSAPLFSTACALQPERKNRPSIRSTTEALGIAPHAITLSRFRQEREVVDSEKRLPLTRLLSQLTTYTPREEIALIDPTNYGDRYFRDINGNLALLEPLVVLHETVGSANSAINFFRTPHPRDEDQASYHTLIRLNGTIVYLVPPDKRAFGAGNSAFKGQTVKTNPALAGSVNNFAYHISLETPADGNNNRAHHSGYTQAQYQSLAWLVAKTGVTDDRITTHKAVDRSSSRMDPRSFEFPRFMSLLQTYPRTTEIAIHCTEPGTDSDS